MLFSAVVLSISYFIFLFVVFCFLYREHCRSRCQRMFDDGKKRRELLLAHGKLPPPSNTSTHIRAGWWWWWWWVWLCSKSFQLVIAIKRVLCREQTLFFLPIFLYFFMLAFGNGTREYLTQFFTLPQRGFLLRKYVYGLELVLSSRSSTQLTDDSINSSYYNELNERVGATSWVSLAMKYSNRNQSCWDIQTLWDGLTFSFPLSLSFSLFFCTFTHVRDLLACTCVSTIAIEFGDVAVCESRKRRCFRSMDPWRGLSVRVLTFRSL